MRGYFTGVKGAKPDPKQFDINKPREEIKPVFDELMKKLD